MLKVTRTLSNSPGQHSRSQSPGQQPSTGGFCLAGPPRKHACLEPRFRSSLAESIASLPRAFSGETHSGLTSQCRSSIHRMSRGHPGSACILQGEGTHCFMGNCANAGDARGEGSIPGSGGSPSGGHGNPLQYSQYSCLEDSIPWRRAWQPTPVSLLGEFHGQTSRAGYNP